MPPSQRCPHTGTDHKAWHSRLGLTAQCDEGRREEKLTTRQWKVSSEPPEAQSRPPGTLAHFKFKLLSFPVKTKYIFSYTKTLHHEERRIVWYFSLFGEGISKSFSITIGNWDFKFKPYTNVWVHTYRGRHNKSGNKLGRLKLSFFSKKKLDGNIMKKKN